MIADGADDRVKNLNDEAFKKIASLKEPSIVPAATHLFEKAVALEEVSRLAANWFLEYL